MSLLMSLPAQSQNCLNNEDEEALANTLKDCEVDEMDNGALKEAVEEYKKRENEGAWKSSENLIVGAVLFFAAGLVVGSQNK